MVICKCPILIAKKKSSIYRLNIYSYDDSCSVLGMAYYLGFILDLIVNYHCMISVIVISLHDRDLASNSVGCGLIKPLCLLELNSVRQVVNLIKLKHFLYGVYSVFVFLVFLDVVRTPN
ncbi:hypothetical protein RND81_02G023300 [Saponaria officinalis]|uniref:Uncharacterized protein n=1 Tax=Saponaria officinalis TaxID=3572 RepID=A0AAW1MK12_SAPOF